MRSVDTDWWARVIAATASVASRCVESGDRVLVEVRPRHPDGVQEIDDWQW